METPETMGPKVTGRSWVRGRKSRMRWRDMRGSYRPVWRGNINLQKEKFMSSMQACISGCSLSRNSSEIMRVPWEPKLLFMYWSNKRKNQRRYCKNRLVCYLLPKSRTDPEKLIVVNCPIFPPKNAWILSKAAWVNFKNNSNFLSATTTKPPNRLKILQALLSRAKKRLELGRRKWRS
jgi:hypothetical protein